MSLWLLSVTVVSMDNSRNIGAAFEEQFYFRQEQIYSLLKLLNEVLQKLDEEVVEHGNLISTRMLGEKLAEERRQKWSQKIQDEMKLFHRYQHYFESVVSRVLLLHHQLQELLSKLLL